MRTILSLGLTSSQTPHKFPEAPEGRRGFQRSIRGFGHPPPFSAPKHTPTFPAGPAEHRGVGQATGPSGPVLSLSASVYPAFPPSPGWLSSGWGFWGAQTARGDFRPGLGWCPSLSQYSLRRSWRAGSLRRTPSGGRGGGCPHHPELGRPRNRPEGLYGCSPRAGHGREGPGGPRRAGLRRLCRPAGGRPGLADPGARSPARTPGAVAPHSRQARPRWRRPDAGAGRGHRPRSSAPEGRARLRGAEEGEAWAGPAPHLSQAQPSEPPARSGKSGGLRGRLGGSICVSLACNLHSPQAYFRASGFSRSGF